MIGYNEQKKLQGYALHLPILSVQCELWGNSIFFQIYGSWNKISEILCFAPTNSKRTMWYMGVIFVILQFVWWLAYESKNFLEMLAYQNSLRSIFSVFQQPFIRLLQIPKGNGTYTRVWKKAWNKDNVQHAWEYNLMCNFQVEKHCYSNLFKVRMKIQRDDPFFGVV